MSTSFEKSVKGATKIKLAPPKAKYVEHILVGTHSGEAGVAEVFRTLQNRLRDSTWTIVFKALIITHMMIKDGQKDVTLAYLAAAPRSRLALNSFTDVQTQGANIRRYGDYLLCRTLAYADTKIDYCKTGAIERMKSLSVDKGLLRETGAIQDQVRALLKCDFFSKESENDIALTAFRLIVQDLLELYTAMNQAIMNVLSHYFELSHPDAERAVKLYKVFTKQTEQVVNFLSVARSYEKVTRLEIPTIKHAPISLEKSLEEYLNDPDFETNRRQYLAAQQGRKGTKFEGKPFGTSSSQPESSKNAAPQNAESQSSQPASSQQAKGPAPDLIDFFDSIEQQQQPMAQQAPADAFAAQQAMATGYGQPNGFQAQQTGTNPFGQFMAPAAPLSTQPTGMGFGGYGPQPPQQFVQPNGQYGEQVLQQTGFPQMVPQQTGFQQQMVPQQTGFQQQMAPQQTGFQQQPGFQQMVPQQTGQPFGQPAQISPQPTNPFRHSMAMPQNSFVPPMPQPYQPMQSPQSTNPFARMSSPTSPPPQQTPLATGGFGQSQLQQFQQQQQQPASMVPQRTGTNPFARAQTQQTGLQQVPEVPQPLAPMATGSTNPFRQSTFVNQQTGRGWHTGQQGTMGGLEHLETMPVFPRPGQ